MPAFLHSDRGSQLVRANKEEILRKEWMFKLVGNESFQVGKSKTVCVIKIEPVGGFTYQYTLEVSEQPTTNIILKRHDFSTSLYT